jgi:tol-pal system protein YbgF
LHSLFLTIKITEITLMPFMTKRRVLGLVLISILCPLLYANAPVATLNTGDPMLAVTTTPSNITITSTASDANSINADSTTANTVTLTQAPVPQVVNSQAVLASLTPDQRIARLENQVQYLNTYTNQINTLSTQVDVLRGQIEDLTHQIAQLQKQLDTLSTSQNTAHAAATEATSAVSTTTNVGPVLPTAAEQGAYQDAYNAMTKKQYSVAIKGFNTFLSKYPKSTLAPNAHYWLGDLYLAQGQPDNASQQYRTVISNQNAAKRPDAMIKLGTILLAYGDDTHAKELFQGIIKQYPGTSAATQAKQRLQGM